MLLTSRSKMGKAAAPGPRQGPPSCDEWLYAEELRIEFNDWLNVSSLLHSPEEMSFWGFSEATPFPRNSCLYPEEESTENLGGLNSTTEGTPSQKTEDGFPSWIEWIPGPLILVLIFLVGLIFHCCCCTAKVERAADGESDAGAEANSVVDSSDAAAGGMVSTLGHPTYIIADAPLDTSTGTTDANPIPVMSPSIHASHPKTSSLPTNSTTLAAPSPSFSKTFSLPPKSPTPSLASITLFPSTSPSPSSPVTPRITTPFPSPILSEKSAKGLGARPKTMTPVSTIMQDISSAPGSKRLELRLKHRQFMAEQAISQYDFSAASLLPPPHILATPPRPSHPESFFSPILVTEPTSSLALNSGTSPTVAKPATKMTCSTPLGTQSNQVGGILPGGHGVPEMKTNQMDWPYAFMSAKGKDRVTRKGTSFVPGHSRRMSLCFDPRALRVLAQGETCSLDGITPTKGATKDASMVSVSTGALNKNDVRRTLFSSKAEARTSCLDWRNQVPTLIQAEEVVAEENTDFPMEADLGSTPAVSVALEAAAGGKKASRKGGKFSIINRRLQAAVSLPGSERTRVRRKQVKNEGK